MATAEWRKSANAVIAGRPRGTHARCAEAAGCTPGTLTQLLAGEISSSIYVGPVSDFLGIPRPLQRALDDDAAEANELFSAFTPQQKQLVLGLMRQLAANDTPEKKP
jgi:hypothetical protein